MWLVWCWVYCSQSLDNLLALALESGHQEAEEGILENTLELNDSGSLGVVASHKSGSPLITDVHRDGGRLGEIEIAIDDVGQVGVV